MNYKKMWQELKKDLELEYNQYDVMGRALETMKILEEKYKQNYPYKLFVTEDGEWEALYRNGKLIHSNHSLRARDILAALEEEAEVYWITNEQFERVNLEMPKELHKLSEVIG